MTSSPNHRACCNPPAVTGFDTLPGSALLSVTHAAQIIDKSRVSIYRLFKAGKLTLVKVGASSRVRVSDLRRLIGAEVAA